MDKSAIDTPSREIDLRNIPVHLSTALRRALEFEARAPGPGRQRKRSSAQLRAIADEFFAPSSPPCCNARCAPRLATPSALVRHLPRRMRSDGAGDRTFALPGHDGAGHDAVLPRETRPSGEAEAGALVVLGIYDRWMQAARSPCTARWPKRRRSSAPTASLDTRPSARPPIATLRGPERLQQSAACGLLDRVTASGWSSPSTGAASAGARSVAPRRKGAQPIPYRLEGTELLILYVVGDDGRPSHVGPDHDGTLRGPELLSYARRSASTPLTTSPTARPGSGDASSASSPRSGSRRQGAGADRLLSCRATLGRGQAAPLERDATHPLAQPTRGLLKRARVDEVITALRELCRGRTAGKIRTHLNYFLKNRHRFAYTTMVGLASAGQPSKAPSVASSISASRAHPSIGYRRASTRFFSCGLSISPADGTV